MTTSFAQNLKATTLAVAITAATVFTGTAPALATDADQQIELVYIWTAKPSMEQQLIGTYSAVGEVLDKHEPGLLEYEISVSETGHQIVIHEVFEDANALAFHLQSTAAQYFPQITEIAVPGPFIFRGDVPEELKAAAYQMDMGAIFTTDWTGFNRGG